MKYLTALVIITLIITTNLEAKKIEGIIYSENDTTNVIFSIPFRFLKKEPNYEKLQYKAKYWDSNGEKITLRPHHAKEIQFKHNHETIRMLSRHNSLGLLHPFSKSSNIFLKLKIDGTQKLFHYYYTQHAAGTNYNSSGMPSGGYSYSVERYVLQKGDEQIKRPSGLTFKKDMKEYFKDCKALVEKIDNKEFRRDDLDSMVEFYNSNCR
jgi:predicted Zn-ribbon and HTH transcriptional regulator